MSIRQIIERDGAFVEESAVGNFIDDNEVVVA